MQDFAAFQRAAPRQQGSCSALKLHAGARKVAPEITACGAIILTVTNVTLCDEGNVGPAATSDAWVGVEYIGPGQQPGELPEKWAQVGYSAKTRIAGSAIIFPPYIWAETNAGPLPDQYNFHPISIHPQTQLPVPGPAGGRPTYDCYQDFESGTWVYRFNFFEFWNWVDPYGGWKGTTGTRYSWAAEVHNKEDGMVGREGQECDFSFLFHAENWGGVEQDFVTELHLFSEDPAQFGTKLSAPDFSDTFLVWDKEP
jgi:hypothetical protein